MARLYPQKSFVAHMIGAVLAFAIVIFFLGLTLLRVFVSSADLIGFIEANPWVISVYVFLVALSTLNMTEFEFVRWYGLGGVIAGGAIPALLGFLGWIGYVELCLTEFLPSVPIYLLVGSGSRRKHELRPY